MLSVITLSESNISQGLFIIAVLTVAMQYVIFKKQVKKFKKEQEAENREAMNKKADVIFVEDKIRTLVHDNEKNLEHIEKETSLKFQLVQQSQEEQRATLEQIYEWVQMLVNNHLK